MPRPAMCARLPLLCATLAAILACHRAPPSATVTPPDLALSGLVAQHVVLLPTYTVSIAPDLVPAVGDARNLLQAFDTLLAATLQQRGLEHRWVFSPALERSYKRNPTYATDPHALGEEPLRSDALLIGARLPEPLASQVRTMVALQEDARYVLAPVELRVERLPSGYVRPAIRLALLDARGSDVRWVGDVKADSVGSFTPAVTSALATRVADLIARP